MTMTNPRGSQGSLDPRAPKKREKKLGPTSPKKKKEFFFNGYIYTRVLPHSSKNLNSLSFNWLSPTSNYSTQKLNKNKIKKKKKKISISPGLEY